MTKQNNEGGGGGRHVNVDTARVARAEVTRMNVAGSAKETSDELLDEIKDAGTGSIKDHLDKIRVAVQDCCTGGAGGAGGSDKASNDLTKAVDNLTKTFKESSQGELSKSLDNLDKNIEVLITTMSTGGGGGEGGGGGGGGGGGPDLARVRQTEQEIQVIGDAFLSLQRDLTGIDRYGKGWIKTLQDGSEQNLGFSNTMARMAKETIEAQTIGAFNSMIESVQDVVSGLADMRAETKKSIAVLKESIDVTRQGVVSAGRFFADDWNQLWEGAGAILTGDFDKLGDSIRNTLRTLETARTEEGLGIASVLVNQTESMDELGQYMKEARSALFEGNHLRQIMKDEEANAALIETLSLQRRAGVIGEMSASELGMQAQRRADTLALIAANTGMTVDQLMNQRKEAPKTWEELHALNRISDQQLKNFQDISKSLGPWSDKLAQAAMHGFDPILLYKEDPEFKKFLIQTGMQSSFEDMLDVARTSSDKSLVEFNNEMKAAMGEMGKDFKSFDERFGKFGKTLVGEQFALGSQTIIAQRTMMELGQSLGDNESLLAKTWNKFTSFFDNMFPGGSVGLMRAVIANTFALWANTGAQMGLGGKILGLGKGLVGGVGKVATLLGGLATKLAPLLLVAGKVLVALAAAAAIGIGIGLMFNKAWEKISEFLGGAGSLGSDIADMVDEVKYAITGDPDSGAAPAKAMNEMTFAEKMKRYGPSWMDAIPGLGAVSMARRTARLVGDTKSMSGPSAPPVPGAPSVAPTGGDGTDVGGVEGKLDRVASAIEEGNRYARETASNTKDKGNRTAAAGNVSLVASGSP